MAIYNHFDGKDGLLDAIWTDGFTMLREARGHQYSTPLSRNHSSTPPRRTGTSH